MDFFNTTTKTGKPARALLSNPKEGLIEAVTRVNAERLGSFLNGEA